MLAKGKRPSVMACMTSSPECFAKNLEVTISYIHVKNSTYFIDIFDINDNKKYSEINILYYENNDFIVKSAKEISFLNSSQFKKFMEFLKKPKKENIFLDEIITIRVNDSGKNFFSKFNFVLHQAYDMGSKYKDNSTNTKGNSIIFNAIINNKIRESKLTRFLQDTYVHNTFIINFNSILFSA